MSDQLVKEFEMPSGYARRESILTFPSLQQPPTVLMGIDGKLRPTWVGSDPLMMDYYDTEWGVPITDEQKMFELLSLLTFQAGLRWRTVLLRRSALRTALAGFSVDMLASWGSNEVGRLMNDATIIRNHRKISAVINNASATKALRSSGDLVETVWSFQPASSPPPRSQTDIPNSIPESAQLAVTLKQKGFVAVGPKSCYALMQAAGVVDTNPLEAHRRGASGMWDAEGNRTEQRKLS